MHRLEIILDSLADEKDRLDHRRMERHETGSNAGEGSSQLSLDVNTSRPAEIEAALQHFVSLKVIATTAASSSLLLE